MKNRLSQSESGFGAVEVLLMVVVIGLLGFVGWTVYNNRPKSAHDTTSTTTNPTTKTATKAADPYANWQKYCSTKEKSCFKYPTDWKKVDVTAADPDAEAVQVVSPTGTTLWFESSLSGIGGGCDPDQEPHIYIHKVIPTKIDKVYIVEMGDKDAVNHIGLKSDDTAPTIGDTGNCIYFTVFKGKADAQADTIFETTNRGQNTLKTADISTVEQILSSYTY